jgi:hypothetical protein
MNSHELADNSHQKQKTESRSEQPNVLTDIQIKRRSIVRTRLVRLIFISYWLLVFEGALRKWGIPQLEEFIFFIRLPVVLVLYGTALSNKAWPRKSWVLYSAYAFGFISALLIGIQMVIGLYGSRYLIIAGYGWYMYFFYIPMSLIIAEQFHWEDIQKFMKLTLWFAIASFILMVFQASAPRDAVINMGFSLDEIHQFRGLPSALNNARPTGFFTSSLGLQMFVNTAMVFVLFSWIETSAERSIPKLLHWVGTLAVLGTIGLSQSRGLVFQIVVIVFAAFIAVLMTRQQSKLKRIMFGLFLLVFLIIFIWPLILPKSYEIFILRLQGASIFEANIFEFGTMGRVLYTIYSFVFYIGDTPPLGYLLGLGGNASINVSWVQMPQPFYQWTGYGGWAEYSLSKHIIELGPYLGLFFIAFRIMLTIYLGWLVLKSTYFSRNTLPILLFGFVGVLIFVERFTSHGTVNGFTWIVFGITLAACRESRFGAKSKNELPRRERTGLK